MPATNPNYTGLTQKWHLRVYKRTRLDVVILRRAGYGNSDAEVVANLVDLAILELERRLSPVGASTYPSKSLREPNAREQATLNNIERLYG